MTDDDIQLTRRKILAGTTAIGAAGIGAGLGTSALFSDEESFDDNMITAGTLDMSVTATIEATNEYWSDSIGSSETADGEPVLSFDVADAKPGDWAIICFDVDVADNPGYVQVSTANLESEENGYTEPEPEDDNGEGELEEAILATVWHDYGGGGRETLSYLDVSTNENRGNQGNIAGHSWTPDRNLGGDNGKVSPIIEYATLREAYDTYQTGVTLGGSDEPTEVGSEEDSAEFCLLLEIPSYIGNEIQGDSVSFDLLFSAEQARNNDSPFESPFPEDPWLNQAQTANGGVFWNHPGDDNEIPLSPGDTFEDLPEPGQPIYVNTTDGPIDVEVDDGNGGTSVALNAGAYDGSDFHDAGSGAPWVRIPTGIGTPHPSGGDNYEFVGITETSSGFEVEWSQV